MNLLKLDVAVNSNPSRSILSAVSGNLSDHVRTTTLNALSLPTIDGKRRESLALTVGPDLIEFPSRLSSHIYNLCDPNNTEICFDDSDVPFSPDEGIKYIELNHELVSEWRLRGDQQMNGIKALLRKYGGILHYCAGIGKTFIAAISISVMVKTWRGKSPPRILWIADTIEQVEQAKDALGLNGPNPNVYRPENIKELPEGHVDVVCWQSAVKFSPQRLQQYDIFVADEIHQAPDQKYKIAMLCTSAWIRIGLTGTLVSPTGRELLIEATYGKVAARVSQHEAVKAGALVSAKVEWEAIGEEGDLTQEINEATHQEFENKKRWLKCELVKEIRKLNPLIGKAQITIEIGINFSERETISLILLVDGLTVEETASLENEYSFKLNEKWRQCRYRHAKRIGILENAERDIAIIEAILRYAKDGLSVLVLVASKDHGSRLQSQIPDSKIVYSQMPAKLGKRENIISDFKTGKLQIVIATSLFDTGADVPRIGAIVMAQAGRGGRYSYKTIQRCARAQRVFGDKQEAIIWDAIDLGDPILKSHSYLRSKGYQSLSFRGAMYKLNGGDRHQFATTQAT